MFRVHLKERPPHNYREAYPTSEQKRQLAMLLEHLWDEGFIMINTLSATVSTPRPNLVQRQQELQATIIHLRASTAVSTILPTDVVVRAHRVVPPSAHQ